MSTPLFQLRDVRKVYNGRQTLTLDALEIERGEVLALVGPSGAGKSTLLRLLNFLEEPTGGTIVFDGEAFGRGRSAPLNVRRRVTTVFQRPVLLQRTVEANIGYGLRLRGGRKEAGLRQRVEHALQEVGLIELAGAQARTLSGGEAQRVALARLLVAGERPSLVILDEPTEHLDRETADALLDDLFSSLSDSALLVITHDQDLMARCARVIDLTRWAVSPALPR